MLIASAKSQLRQLVKKRLAHVLQQSLEQQSYDVLESLKRYPPYANAGSVAFYMSMPLLELQTLNLIKDSFLSKKLVYLPKCIGRREGQRHHLQMLKVESFKSVLELTPRGKYQLREPETGVDALDGAGLDIIVVPGVAFSTEGHRMGHGAGYYDEFITRYTERFKRSPHLVGVALMEQMVETIPQEPHDWKMDAVIAGDGSVFERVPM